MSDGSSVEHIDMSRKLDTDNDSSSSFSAFSDEEDITSGYDDDDETDDEDSYIEHKENSEKLRNWMKTRHELLNTPNDLIEITANKIINNVFGGIQKMLTFLMDKCDNKQIKEIYQIIKHTNLEYKKSKKSKPSKRDNNDDNDINMDKKEMNYFNIISNESISYILGFLDHDEIEKVKILSSRIGIICLEEMMKFEANIFNMNELINHNYNNKIIDEDNIEWSLFRFNANRTIQSLQEQCSKMYGIKEEDQILFPDQFEINNNALKQFKKKTQPNIKISHLRRRIIMFDKKTVIKINQRNEMNVMSSRDELDDDHELVILKYCDILNQSVDVIQYIVIHKNVKYSQIMEYIQNYFVPITKKQKLFHNTFANNIKKMQFDNSNQDILSLYHHQLKIEREDDGIEEWEWHHVDTNSSIYELFKYNKCKTLIFELNCKHNWIQQQLGDADKYQNFIDLQTYLDNIRTIFIKSKCDIQTLKLQIESFGDCIVSGDIDEFDRDKGKKYEIQNESITYGELKEMIVNDLGNNVNLNNIEIDVYRGFYNNDALVDVEDEDDFNFVMVSYNTWNRSNDKVIYEIDIFLPNNAPFPFYDSDKSTKIRFEYDRTFIVDNMINYIFDDVLKRAMYCNYIETQEISKLYETQRNDLEFVLTAYCDTYYKSNDQFETNRTAVCWVTPKVKLRLFMLLTPIMARHSIKIKIYWLDAGFVLNKRSLFSEIKEYQLISFPMEICIEQNQSIKDIINSNYYLNKYKKYINNRLSYKVKENDNMVAISTANYTLLNNDVIIISIRHNPNDSQYIAYFDRF